jgi:glucose-1-phosphate cytidylyltransferase
MNSRIEPSKTPVFILAGGHGTRISEESQFRPKPMIEIGGEPILLHIMRSYYAHGFNDFVICAGYKSWEIKQYFLTYNFRKADIEIDHREDGHSPARVFGKTPGQENWRVRVIDTGSDCMTGGRIARAFDAVKGERFENFAVTYGDGVSDVALDREFAAHHEKGLIGTVLGVHPSARFGELTINSDRRVTDFSEKPQSRSDLINGGFFFFQTKFRDYLSTDADCILERAPLNRLAKDGQLSMYPHTGFWQPMDTLRDKNYLESLIADKKAPWMKDTR